MLKRLQQFPEAVFLVVAMEALLSEGQVSLCQTTVTAQKHLNFLSDRWITLKILQEFLEAIFLVVAIESLLCETKGRSRQTRVKADPPVGSLPNFYKSFWRPFFL